MSHPFHLTRKADSNVKILSYAKSSDKTYQYYNISSIDGFDAVIDIAKKFFAFLLM